MVAASARAMLRSVREKAPNSGNRACPPPPGGNRKEAVMSSTLEARSARVWSRRLKRPSTESLY